MPITSVTVRDGDPTIQSSGQYRGTVTATFDDGRIVERSLRAVDEADWLAQVAGIGAIIQAQVEIQDAKAAVDSSSPIAANLEASHEQVAYQYFLAAYESDDEYQAYLLFAEYERWYKLDAGWANESQMLTGMAPFGLTSEEWDWKTGTVQSPALTWLTDPGNVNKMEQVQAIQSTWQARKSR